MSFRRRPSVSALLVVALLLAALVVAPGAVGDDVRLRGVVVDAESGAPLPARLYVRAADGGFHTVRSASSDGSAVAYRKERGPSVEVHTSLSAHPFVADLPAGEYLLEAERGKEYVPVEKAVSLASTGEEVEVELRLVRWIDMAARGWYSGDTHVHRSLAELPAALLAEDLNVAFPLLYWVTRAYVAPAGDPATRAIPAGLIEVDPTHVIWPRNTEYEIFTVDGARHELGAVFILGHRTVFEQGVPPVAPLLERARAEGALFELDKHSWPWSMCLVPLLDVDLYELSNNHIWRTDFFFRDWGVPPPDSMQIERHPAGGLSERGWIDYGWKNYYALLNCGFRLRPTAGTASGVHPVPLGFGRVYVELDDGFDYSAWLAGLDAGRSFVTTGPMLFVRANGEPPGATLRAGAGPENAAALRVELAVEVRSSAPLERVELVENGRVIATSVPAGAPDEHGVYTHLEAPFFVARRSSWYCVRAIARRPGGRISFAHSSPIHVEIDGKPLVPRRADAELLVERARVEIARSAAVLSEEALAEYRKALAIYERIAENAR